MKDNKPTIQDVEQMAANAGITFTAEDYEQAYRVGEQRRAQVEADQAIQNRSKVAALVDWFNRLFPRILRALFGIGDVAVVLVQTIFVGPGLLIVLLMLLVVEQQRIFYGLKLFELHEGLATFGAIVLVVVNLSLELWAAFVEHQIGWQEPPKHEFSLRLVSQRLAYMSGRETGWKPAPKSPANRFRSALRLVTITILVLAGAGSMESIIKSTPGTWLDAIGTALTKSTLAEMSAWIGGLLFALCMVICAQLVGNYAARKAIEIGAALSEGDTDAAVQASGMTAAIHLLAKMKSYQRQRRSVPSAAMYPRVENVISVPIVPEPIEMPTATKVSPAIQKAIDWLERNDSTGMSYQQMADAAETSKASMFRAVLIRKERS